MLFRSPSAGGGGTSSGSGSSGDSSGNGNSGDSSSNGNSGDSLSNAGEDKPLFQIIKVYVFLCFAYLGEFISMILEQMFF